MKKLKKMVRRVLDMLEVSNDRAQEMAQAASKYDAMSDSGSLF